MRFKNFMGSTFSFCRVGLFFLLITSIYACKKETEYPSASLVALDGTIRITNLDTAVTLTWNKAFTAWEGESKPAVHYEIEVSSDATFGDPAQNVYAAQIDSAFIHLNENQLTHFEEYYARVRAIAGSNEARSNWLQTAEFHILDEVPEINIFRTVKNHELIDKGVILRWEKNDDVTEIVLYADGFGDQPFAILGDDRANARRVIEGLTPNQEYTAQLFADERSMGIVSFKTKQGLEGLDFVDLRSSSDPAVLRQALESAADGETIVLKRGQVYTFTDTYLFEKSVKIMSEPGFTDPAHIQISSSLNVRADAVIGSIMFEDVMLTSNISGGYVFNIQANGKIGEIVFENCMISDHRGVVRVRTADSNPTSFEVENYKINNCIVQNIGDFAVSCVSSANANLRNVSITNSTINNANRVIYVSVNRRDNHDYSCTINNVTIYNSGAGRFYDLMNDGLFTYGFTFTNSIYGASAANNSRANSSMSIIINNTFMTSDVTGSIIAGITSAGKSSAQVFTAPASDDFTIRDSELFTVGDPRWRP